MMLEIKSSLAQRPVPPRMPEAPQMIGAFLGRHAAALVLIVVVVAQLLVLGYQVTRKHNVRLVQVWAADALDPFERSTRGLTDLVSGTIGSATSLSQAGRQNKQLRRELAEARAEARQLAEDGAENAQLRSLLDLQQHVSLKTLAADVIGASPGSSSAIYIDRGKDDGLAADEPVITPDGVAGKTVAVFRHTAEVLLITDPTSGAGAMIAKSGEQGVLKGNGDGVCTLNYIANGSALAAGDRVVTSGLDQIYPKGLLLGVVASVRPGSLYDVITVKPAAQLDRLEEVLVVLRQPQVGAAQEQKHHR